MTIYQADSSIVFCDEMRIKGRGNSTWLAPKKPYTIKFDQSVSLISLPEDKSWVMLSNYFDSTLIRNDLAFFIGNELSVLDWTPHYQYVDLSLNGEYVGVYQLGEKVKASGRRVNTGKDGVLMEIDWRCLSDDDRREFYVPHIKNPINIKSPNVEYGDDTYTYAKMYVEAADAALFSADFRNPKEGWQKYIDINSFVDWYIINEIAKNADAEFGTSCYMYLKRGDKLKMGPLWDFDLAFGNYLDAQHTCNQTDGFWVKDVKWFNRLFEDPVFLSKVKERMSFFYNNRQALYHHIDMQASVLIQKVYAENKLYGNIADVNATEIEVQKAYEGHINALKNWIEARFIWLHTHINSITIEQCASPM